MTQREREGGKRGEERGLERVWAKLSMRLNMLCVSC